MVPVFNKAPYLREVLGTLNAAVRSYGDAELIVVDHESTDGGAAILAVLEPAPDVSLSAPRGTIAAARNLGAARATGSHLSFVDADCVVPVDYLDRVAEVIAAVDAGACGCRVRPPASSAWPADAWHGIHAFGRDGARAWLAGASLTVERAAFESVGGFDEAKETQEDIEFCSRLRGAGYRIWEAQSLSATHLDNPATLSGFFRKEAWRARGAFDGRSGKGADRATLAMALHLALLGAGAALAWGGPGPEAVRVAVTLALAFAVPLASVLFRGSRARRLYRPAAGVVLYQAYYLARAAAFVRSVWKRWAGPDAGEAVDGRPPLTATRH